MPVARIIDETQQRGPIAGVIRQVLGSAGYGIVDDREENAGLTVLLHKESSSDHGGSVHPSEGNVKGDMLVLMVPPDLSRYDSEPQRTEIVGSNRLKARHRLRGGQSPEAMAEELKSIVGLFRE